MKPIVLCILDGVGIRDEVQGNAFLQAHIPTFDYLWENYPHCQLEASGEAVGLPKGQMGNSEVGHMNIGAGRIVYQPLTLINQAIENKSFYNNKAILDTIDHVHKNQSKLHLLGLLSDGGVHSHIDQLFAFIDLCTIKKVKEVYLHIFTDGRDTSPTSSLQYIHLLQDKIKNLPNYKIATICGRYYAMDRDNRWERIQRAYEVITKGINKVENIDLYIKDSYEKGIEDEFIIPATIDEKGLVEDHDGLLVFNYRPDRLRELLGTITNPTLKSFERKNRQDLSVTTMMNVSEDVISTPAFQPPNQNNLLGQVLSSYGLAQLRIAETEKYAHVTYFFDGGKEVKIAQNDHLLIPSPPVATYDMAPAMSAEKITDELIKRLEKEHYDVVILNYANGDMVGHTGNLSAAISSLETLDQCLDKLYHTVLAKNGILIVTADHGNCELMLDEKGNKVTSHTTNPVPFIITDKTISLSNGKLCDIAPTILTLLEKRVPKEMTGVNLIRDTIL